jgi:hypothetical protein
VGKSAALSTNPEGYPWMFRFSPLFIRPMPFQNTSRLISFLSKYQGGLESAADMARRFNALPSGAYRKETPGCYMSKRGKGLEGEIGTFLREYRRKAQRHVEPNDRHYDRNVEKKIKSTDPRRLSELMHDDAGIRVPREVEDCWYVGNRIEGIDFYYNDAVLVAEGANSGEGGAVVSLLRLNPEPEYLIELGSGAGDIKVFQSNLTHL